MALTEVELEAIKKRARGASDRVGKTVGDVEFDRHALGDIQRLVDEVERLRVGLDAVRTAECCGCSVYAEIADAFLEGKPVIIETSGAKTWVRSADGAITQSATP